MQNLITKLCISPLIGCFALLFLFVLSLYVWQNTHQRDDPAVIKKRFLSVMVTSVLSPFAIYLFSSSDFISKYNFFDLIGLRLPGIFMAATVPLVLTAILFLGPLCMQSHMDNCRLYSETPQHYLSPSDIPQMTSKGVSPTLKDLCGIDRNIASLKPDYSTSKNADAVDIHSGTSMEENSVDTKDHHISTSTIPKYATDIDGLSTSVNAIPPNTVNSHFERDNINNPEPRFWLDCFNDLQWLRDHIVAPFSEELTFRACMLPLLIQCYRPQNAVFICPVFFGLAHFHHIYGRIKSGYNLRAAVLASGFQFLFTTIFGAYSAYLFLRTGHLIAPFLAHSFCNHLGFPNFREIWYYDEPKRSVIAILCVIGFVAWCYLLEPLTDPAWYGNKIYWKV